MTLEEARRKPKKIYTSRKVKTAVAKIVENHGNIRKSMLQAGYAENTASNPKNLLETKAFQHEIKPVLEQYERIRENILKDLETRDTSETEYPALALALKNITHDIQLLSGNKTENVGVEQERATLQAVLVALRT